MKSCSTNTTAADWQADVEAKRAERAAGARLRKTNRELFRAIANADGAVKALELARAEIRTAAHSCNEADSLWSAALIASAEAASRFNVPLLLAAE
jgi:hypothetical protein